MCVCASLVVGTSHTLVMKSCFGEMGWIGSCNGNNDAVNFGRVKVRVYCACAQHVLNM